MCFLGNYQVWCQHIPTESCSCQKRKSLKFLFYGCLGVLSSLLF